MSVFDDGAQTALTLIAEYGVDIVISRSVESDFDDIEGIAIDAPDLVQTVKAIIEPKSKDAAEAFDIKMSKEELVEAQLRSVTIAAKSTDFLPHPQDKVMFGGIDWLIIGVTPEGGGGVDIIYKFTVKS